MLFARNYKVLDVGVIRFDEAAVQSETTRGEKRPPTFNISWGENAQKYTLFRTF